MPAISRRLLGLATLLAALAAPVHAQVVVSQVYGGGGNTGATFKNDFIELFNRGSAAVDVTGWSVQYTSAAGTTWQATSLAGTIQPGQYFLVREAQGAGGTADLPTPDAAGTIPMSATAGKVALVNTTTLLTGSGCPFAASVQDFVGFGTTANCSEGTPTPAPSNTTAVLRAGLGCTDTNNNAVDFAAGVPTPRNTASAFNPCAGALTITTASPLPNGTVGQPYSVTFTASGGTGTGYTFTQVAGTLPPGLTLTDSTLSGMPLTTTGSPFSFTMQVTDSGANFAQKEFQLTVEPALVCNTTSTIAQIQGSGDASPLAGSIVTTNGIVTGVKTNGFFIQMPAPGDGDPMTSDGVFVFTSSAPPAAAAVGNDVCVTGIVQEFIPPQDLGSPPATEITSPTVFAITSGNPLPPAVALTAADTDPAGPIDQLEKYEGMRVHVGSLTAVSPTQGTITESSATSVTNGVFYGVITGVARPFREPGVEVPDALPPGAPATVTRFDSNPERLRVDSDGQIGATPINVTSGAVVTGLTGPLDYSFRTYTILPDPATPPAVSGNVSATPVTAPGPGQLTIAAFNVERFYDATDDPNRPNINEPVLSMTAFNNRLNKVSLVIRSLMRTPDIVGFEEVENLSTLQAIADKVNADAVAAGDPNPVYVAYLEEGNDIGGIDVGFLVKTARVTVVDVTQEGKNATYINPNNGQPELLNDRPPLVLRAEVQRPDAPSYPVTVIANHLRSLSGIDDPADGNRVRTKRRAQAEFLAILVQHRQEANPAERIVLVGDFNAFQFSDGYVDVIGTVKGTPTPADEVVLASSDLVNPDLTDLVDMVPADQRYSYSFDGNAQVIDHVLVTGNLLASVANVQFARADADFPEVLRNDPTRPERISDHDPVVATFNLPAAIVLEASPNPSGFGEPVTLTATVTFFGAPVTLGTITFSEGATVLGGPTDLNASGQASFATSTLGPGPHAITAAYSGAPGVGASSTSVTQTVGAAPSQTVLASSANPSGVGQPVTFTATVTSLGTAVTQGSVVFREGGTVLGGPVALDAGGHASFSTSSLGLGTHTITADYSGTALAQPSSDSIVQTVRAGLSISDAFVKEGDFGTNFLSFVVTLSPAAGQPVTVTASTVDGTATAGSDYIAGTTPLTFSPGVVRQTVRVAVKGDRVWEDDETLTVRLSNAVNATIVHGDGVGTILNDDALPTIRISDPIVREGNSGLTPVAFRVSLSHPSSRAVTVAYATADGTARAGSDYVAIAGTLTFAPGTVAQYVVVNVNGDTLVEPSEFFFLQATSATNAVIGYGRGIAVILNDDRDRAESP